jgi:hypothetical protein
MSICQILDEKTLKSLESQTKLLLRKLEKDNFNGNINLDTFTGGMNFMGLPMVFLIYTASLYNEMNPTSKSVNRYPKSSIDNRTIEYRERLDCVIHNLPKKTTFIEDNILFILFRNPAYMLILISYLFHNSDKTTAFEFLNLINQYIKNMNNGGLQENELERFVEFDQHYDIASENPIHRSRRHVQSPSPDNINYDLSPGDNIFIGEQENRNIKKERRPTKTGAMHSFTERIARYNRKKPAVKWEKTSHSSYRKRGGGRYKNKTRRKYKR